MSKTTYHGRPRLTEAEREQRRTAQRERVKDAAEQLLTSDGWQRWVLARSMFRRYSAHNCMLIALDFHLRGIEPEPVAGFRTWLKLGRCVRKGEHGIRIAARVTPKKTDQSSDSQDEQTKEEREQRPVRFTAVVVFGLSQTDLLPDAEELPLEPPHEPLSGDSHAHLLEPLGQLATQLGYTVSFEEIPGATGGWCDSRAKRIVVDAAQAVNGQVRTLVHELVHALGVELPDPHPATGRGDRRHRHPDRAQRSRTGHFGRDDSLRCQLGRERRARVGHRARRADRPPSPHRRDGDRHRHQRHRGRVAGGDRRLKGATSWTTTTSRWTSLCDGRFTGAG